jgi:hypothetical protein
VEKRYRATKYALPPRAFWLRFAAFTIASGVVSVLMRVSGFYAFLTSP